MGVGFILSLVQVGEWFDFMLDGFMIGRQSLLHVLACCVQVKTEALAKAAARKERASEDTGGSSSNHSSSGSGSDSDSDGSSNDASGDVSQGVYWSLA